ncbi:MAG TPA: hypothetical protein VIX86_12540 [Streptosporangiaceae bacterium]
MGEPVPVAEGGLIGSALRAVGEGASANAWLRALSEGGTGVRRAVGLRIFGQAKALAAEYQAEPTRAVNQVPSRAEMRSWPTRASSGVLQTVQIFYRERVTGRIVQRYYSVKTDTGVTRGEAIQRAIDANSDNAEQYEQDFIGAVHTGAASLVAGAVA